MPRKSKLRSSGHWPTQIPRPRRSPASRPKFLQRGEDSTQPYRSYLIVAIMVVREFPPRLSFSKNVSTLSLYGTLPPAPPPPPPPPPPPSLPPSLLEPALEEEDPPDFVDSLGDAVGDPTGDENGDEDGDKEGEGGGLCRPPPPPPAPDEIRPGRTPPPGDEARSSPSPAAAADTSSAVTPASGDVLRSVARLLLLRRRRGRPWPSMPTTTERVRSRVGS